MRKTTPGGEVRPFYQIKRLRDAGTALRITQELRQIERWPRDRLVSHQANRLAALVQHAVATSPFYRERLSSRTKDGDLTLEELPILTKSTMMECFDDLVTDRRLTRSNLERHVAELSRDQYYLGRYRALVTGGSTGLRGLFVYDRPAWNTVLASAFYSGSVMGFSPRLPRSRYAFVGAPSPAHLSNRLPASADVGTFRMLRLELTRPLDELVHRLNLFQPDIMQAFPSVGALLAIEQLEGRLHIRPQFVITTAEMRTPEMEAPMREAWGVQPYNLYAMTELGIVGSECPEHAGIHLNEDLAILEPVDENNRPVPPGSQSFKVLVTNLFNYTQPLIRYEISDMLTIAPEPCPCGRPLALVSSIEGRNDDMLILRAPDGRKVKVHPILVRGPLGARHDVRQYQIVNDEKGLHVVVVLAREASRAACVAAVAENLRSSLSEVPVQVPPIDVRVVDSIPREGGPAAKMKLVRCVVAAGSHEASNKP